MIIEKAIQLVLENDELMQHPVAYATITALQEFVDNGGKLSELPWFKGLNFELLESESENISVTA